MPNGADPPRKWRRGRRQLAQVAAMHGKGTDRPAACVDHPERVTCRVEASVLGRQRDRAWLERCAAKQGKGAIGGDRVPGDAGHGRIHREENLAVVADLDPAGRRLIVRERRGPDGRQRGVGCHPARRHRPGVRGGVVGVGNQELTHAGWPELAAKRARPWAGNGEPGAAARRPSRPTARLSMRDAATRVPASRRPSPLKSTSPGWDPAGRAMVE
jgi:hypothetical protein